jgi:capsular exopolysaccharide synthesis family protein
MSRPFDLFLDQYPSRSRFAEAYRILRTNIQFSFIDKDVHTLVVTSAGQEEGKTSTVANLSYTMAQAGKTVLMVDADLRKPFLSHLAPSQDSPGLTGLLSNLFGKEVRQGSLKECSVSDLFRLLMLQKKTGLLHLSEEKEDVEVLFFQGELIDLNWLTRPADKKLASLLMKNELIKNKELQLAITKHKTTGQKLGLILINMGLLKQEDLKGLLDIHMMEGLRTALQFKKGSFHFKGLAESDFDRTSFDPVDFHQLYKQTVIGEEALLYLQREIDSAILKTGTDNLFLLPSGVLPPNPSELLGSERISFLISYLKKRFDILVIDTPPVLLASDALLLVPHSDGVILLVKAGMMNRELIKKAVDQLELGRANLLGVVLNQVDVKREGYYKYYHKYYSEYYGESS